MEYRIDKLRPGARYAFQIRSLNDEETSDWSPAFYVTLPTDTSIPADVGAITATYTNKSFKFSWAAVTTNSDSTPAYDIKNYQATISDGVETYVSTVTDTEIYVSETDYLTKLGNGATVSCSVVAIDLSGNESTTPSSDSATAPVPDDVTNFTALPKVSGIDLRWSPVQNVSIQFYEIYYGDTAGFTPDTATFTNLLGTTAGDLITWSSGDSDPSTKYFKIRAKSIFGDYSVNFVTANTTTTTVDIAVTTTETHVFSYTGALIVTGGTHRLYIEETCTIVGVRASVGVAPTGSSVIVDVNKNGTTIFTTQGNRPTIAASGFTSGKITNMNVTSLAAGDYITVDIDQIGSTVAGSDLTVQVILEI
jgi:hypothetical protein